MSDSNSFSRKLDRLIDSLVVGRLTAVEEVELDELVATNLAARHHYLERMFLIGQLQWRLGMKANNGTSETGVIEASATPVAIKMPGLGRRITLTSRLLGLAASLVLVGYFFTLGGLVVWDRMHVGDHRMAMVDDPSNSSAVLIHADDAHWQRAANSAAEHALENRTLQVSKGLAELEFANGAKVIVEGPAEFEVRSPNGGLLRHGKLVAIVPRKAIGFTVETPNVQVVDLGTEFEVAVDEAGRTDVQVFTGAVDISYSSAVVGAKPVRNSLRMTAGSAKRFSTPPGAALVTITELAPWLDAPANAIKHARQGQNLPAETKYATVVLADKPLGYWRLSDNGDGRAVDASGHGRHGTYSGFVSTSNPGIKPNTNDRSVRFLGPSYAGYVQLKDFEFPASFTVELWARSAAPEWNAWGWLFSSRVPNGVVICPCSLGTGWQFALNSSKPEVRLIGAHAPAKVSDRFHYYVGTYDTETDRGWMYFDGKLVSEASSLLGNDRRRESIPLTFYVGRDEGTPVFGEGWIDEVAIYQGALPAEAIQRHFEAAELEKVNVTEDQPSSSIKE
jgi:hypothetical protein